MPKRIYPIDTNFQIVLKDLGIDPQHLLKRAGLPLDLLSRKQAGLSPQAYFDLFEAMESLAPSPTFPLVLGQAVTVESFSPPVFACFCSPNLKLALGRLAHYKDLVAPMQFVVEHTSTMTRVRMLPLPELEECPGSIMATEYVFLTHMARLATRENIVPQAVFSTHILAEQAQYEAFLGCNIQRGNENQICFTAVDAERPFLSANERFWEMFEPDLNLRLNALKQEDSVIYRVRACLSGMLAGGDSSIHTVAHQLAVSPRTLQRQLKGEDTSFQIVLTGLRHDLALQYLKKDELSDLDIAFLLGYQETNSFVRAFQQWTGKSPRQMRRMLLAV